MLSFVEGKFASSPGMGNAQRAVWLADGDFVVCVVTEGADIERSAAAMKHAAHATQVLPDLLAALEQVQADIGARLTGKTVLMIRAAIAKAKGN